MSNQDYYNQQQGYGYSNPGQQGYNQQSSYPQGQGQGQGSPLNAPQQVRCTLHLQWPLHDAPDARNAHTWLRNSANFTLAQQGGYPYSPNPQYQQGPPQGSPYSSPPPAGYPSPQPPQYPQQYPPQHQQFNAPNPYPSPQQDQGQAQYYNQQQHQHQHQQQQGQGYGAPGQYAGGQPGPGQGDRGIGGTLFTAAAGAVLGHSAGGHGSGGGGGGVLGTALGAALGGSGAYACSFLLSFGFDERLLTSVYKQQARQGQEGQEGQAWQGGEEGQEAQEEEPQGERQLWLERQFGQQRLGLGLGRRQSRAEMQNGATCRWRRCMLIWEFTVLVWTHLFAEVHAQGL
ncbi:hypothetical protein B0T24DRAFT_249138 [Lasiosphaeria ovina]|uniref:Uncharacterized protein n=1 Tax=Lasiosphaeria ovina TaxID=92902 RepID=A0AAE0KAC9_9PEZI|nr:hypothetical protein B0T24DRAFT_249138 [Lasiosphaeria ovina]